MPTDTQQLYFSATQQDSNGIIVGHNDEGGGEAGDLDAPQIPAQHDHDSSADSSGSATATCEMPRTAPPKVDQLPPWKVLLHNDDVNDMPHVVESIVMLTPLARADAVNRMLEAHVTGVALLLMTHQERAELYRDQFQSRLLKVTIEPAG